MVHRKCEYGRKMVGRSQVFEELQHDRIWGFTIENVLILKIFTQSNYMFRALLKQHFL